MDDRADLEAHHGEEVINQAHRQRLMKLTVIVTYPSLLPIHGNISDCSHNVLRWKEQKHNQSPAQSTFVSLEHIKKIKTEAGKLRQTPGLDRSGQGDWGKETNTSKDAHQDFSAS